MVQKVWPGLELGIDAYLKTTRDLLDDGQFGAAVVLNGFNYAEGQNTGVELKAVYTNGNLRAYANWAWAIQRATNIVTNQYLFGADEIAYIQNNWINTDHSQVWTGSGGHLLSLERHALHHRRDIRQRLSCRRFQYRPRCALRAGQCRHVA